MAEKSVHLIIGAAGHIDHGKTSLIKTLTGIDCDRLEEEKRRGITIDLGFAMLPLPDGRVAGIVDAPGHQRFVHNMLAGATGIDIALIVVAADDAVMPQTIEHLSIMELLNIKRGVVAITKADLVDAETLELARADVAGLLESSSFAGSRIIPCSTVTGLGVEEIRQELFRLASEPSEKPVNAFFRLPIDRVFTIKGHGLVVTGSVYSGSASADDWLEVIPGNIKSRVRRVQSHGKTVESVSAGTRAAINITGPEKDDLKRGMALCHPAIAAGYTIFNGEITCHRLSPLPIVHGRSYFLHVHTAETLCRVFLGCEARELKPGERCFGQVRFEKPIHLLHGDRFVLRSSSAMETVGGGTVLLPGGKPLGKRKLGGMKSLWESLARKDSGMRAMIASTKGGMGAGEVARLFNIPPKDIPGVIGNTQGISSFEWKGSTWFYDDADGERIVSSVVSAVERFHKQNPALLGMEESLLYKTALAGMDESLAAYWVRRAARDKKLEFDGPLLKLAGRSAVFEGENETARLKFTAVFQDAGLAPPKPEAVFEKLGLKKSEGSKLLKSILQRGDIVSVAPDFMLAGNVYSNAREKLVAELKLEGKADTARYRDILGCGRKTAIDLLEHFDKTGLTKRVDNKGTRILLTLEKG
ncbi:MAG: selenocysteine-specific translation elongation factor [Nitrospinae bacterium]|nr:selenocysteine-specific translation elongation factor [Nitrospinota bacterium]